jgi:MFS family permease
VRVWPSGGLWRHPDFLKLWSAETISQFGTQVSQLALPLVAILVLDATAFEVAALGTIEFLPFILFTLPAGVWVDRLPRRPILIAGDFGRAALLASIPIAYVADALTLWQLYVVGFLVGICTVFFDVAYQSYLPSLVQRDHIIEGNSKLEMSRSGAQVGGPGFAGALVEIFTAPYAVLVDAVSFVGSGLFLLRIHKPEDTPVRKTVDGRKTSLWTELKEGFRFVLGNPNLRAQAGCTGTSNFFSNVAYAIILVYLVRRGSSASPCRSGAPDPSSPRSPPCASRSGSASARPPSPSALSGDRRRCSSPSRRPETRPFRSSSPPCSSAASRSSSTTSSR